MRNRNGTTPTERIAAHLQRIHRPPVNRLLAAATVAGVAFQIGHFAEHAYQFYHLSVDATKPWMSDAADWLVRQIGVVADCGSKVGMEVLHLGGNTIFLVTLAMLVVLFPRKRALRWALLIEGFHLMEHLTLVTTVMMTGTAMGLSTLVPGAPYRVTWHFVMNLIPSALMMAALMPAIRARKECACA